MQRLAGPLLRLAQQPCSSAAAAAAASSSGAPLLQHAHAAAAAAAASSSHSQHQQTRPYATAKPKGKQQQKGGAKKGAAAASSKKKGKQRIEAKPFNDKDPLLQRVISMLVPQDSAAATQQQQAAFKAAQTPESLAAARARAKEYSRRKMLEHHAWRTDLHAKLQLKAAAVAALPAGLREAAMVEDLEPFPLTRHALYETPPEGYRS